jgi:MOSC domain-containing protein YiiM
MTFFVCRRKVIINKGGDVTRIFIGSIKAIRQTGTPTGIYKEEVREPILCSLTGFTGDKQADLSVHGGADKAIHYYPDRHYLELKQFFPEIIHELQPGSLGENLSHHQFDESNVHIGDVWQIGQAFLQITQPRHPCWKIDAKFETKGLTAFIVEQLLTGWYFKVLEPGLICPDDNWVKVSSSNCRFTLKEVQHICRQHRPPIDDLDHICNAEGIAKRWSHTLVERVRWLESHPHS